MDIHNLKQKIDASGKKLNTLGQEYARAKDDVSARKVLVKFFNEIAVQNLFLAEQIAQLDRNQRGIR